ncbi:DC-STAMP domain-containing protein 2 [Polyodon spathula]|uniref:DC-STAMP domain-containing protein 2 n=1 Tax=Polyodon spathula TaxID=7913 RepID=UPI001B7F65AD|nr:DC-STAMP domain-containing protein 2 [Polyodon spathula]
MGDNLKDKLSQEACIKTLCCCCLQFDSCKSPADLERGAAAGARRKRRKRQPQVRRPAPLKEAVRSLGGFFFGLALSSCYAGMVLFVHSYGMWYCLLSTVTIATFCSFGMGLSVRIRSNVFLMLPMICSKEGKNILLFMAFTLAIQGPTMNILDNFERAAEAVSCGVELALNQTKELVEKVTTPLAPVLNKIKNISKNAKVVADKVRRFLKSLMSSVKHVARILRNVLHFLVNIGEICNDQLGSPYRKCIKIFDDARADCLDVMSFFGFLCYIVDVFKPLCGLAYIIQLFCIIPTYIMGRIREKTSNPVMAAFEKMKDEFEFNISSSSSFSMHFNKSKSIFQVAADIMEEVSVELDKFQEFIGLFGYATLFLVFYMYLQAVLYRKKYLFQDDYDNNYITNEFVEMDIMRAQHDKNTVLPLSQDEALKYVRPCSLYMTGREKRTYIWNITNVFRHMLICSLVVVIDYIIFWIFDMVRYYLQGEIIARAPVQIAVDISGSGYAADIYKDIVASFDILQQANISVLSKKCRMNPTEPDYMGYLIIGGLYGMSFFIVVAGNYVTRLRRFVCASYYPSRERERICFLYNQILSKRTSLPTALMQAIKKNTADEGHTSMLMVLGAKFPGCGRLVQFMGVYQSYCMACGKVAEGKYTSAFITCITPGCKGLYCTQCFKKLNNVCTICMSPLTFEDDNEEELDSSDEEKVKLWISAMKAMKNMELEKKRELRKLLKRRIKEALRKKVDKGGQGLPKELRKRTASEKSEERSESDTSSNISSQSSDSNSDLDFNYQDKSESEHTPSSEDDPEAFLEKRKQRVQMSRQELSDDSSEDSSGSQAEETKGSENAPEQPVREEPPAAPEETPPGDDFLASLNRAKTDLQETAPSAAPAEREDDLTEHQHY